MTKAGFAHARHVLVLNSGSSSLKFGLFAVTAGEVRVVVSGAAEYTLHKLMRFRAMDAQHVQVCEETQPWVGVAEVVSRIARLLEDWGAPAPQAVGHRVVHGGPDLRQHRGIDEAVLSQLQAAQAWAPLHTPAVLAGIRQAQREYAGLPQMACLDTAFHANLPAVAQTLPLPAPLRAQGLKRYGFHGLSCESVVRQLEATPHAAPRLLVAHLGSGASLTAVREGVSVDTSMGLTPSGGLIMGTRSGDMDPGVLIYLAREKGYDAASLEALLDHRSGLVGISGLSGDMRVLHAAAPTNPQAALAIEMFVYAVRKQLAALWVVLGGADALVFTGGIGEHDAVVRAAVCEGLGALGVQLDPVRDAALTNPVSTPASSCRVWVLPSMENEQVARHTADWLVRDANRSGETVI